MWLLAVIKMRRSNSWSESYEDFTVAEESSEPAESSKEMDKDRIWSVCVMSLTSGHLLGSGH